MKKIGILAAAQAVFTMLQVYLVSEVSTIGKLGIALFYHEYQWLRSTSQTFLIFFGFQVAIIAILYYIRQHHPARSLKIAATGCIAIAFAGLYFTYDDFINTYSHRLLKERFHLGFYLFWIGIVITGVFFHFNSSSTFSTQSAGDKGNNEN